jgi:hypothetical protein
VAAGADDPPVGAAGDRQRRWVQGQQGADDAVDGTQLIFGESFLGKSEFSCIARLNDEVASKMADPDGSFGIWSSAALWAGFIVVSGPATA